MNWPTGAGLAERRFASSLEGAWMESARHKLAVSSPFEADGTIAEERLTKRSQLDADTARARAPTL